MPRAVFKSFLPIAVDPPADRQNQRDDVAAAPMTRMTQRLKGRWTVPCGQSRVAALLLAVIMAAASVTAARAQSPGRERRQGKAAKPSRTAWGHPDLQGIWTSGPMSSVPFERPAGLGTRALLSEQEFAARVAANQALDEVDNDPFVRPWAAGDEGPRGTSGWASAERGKPSLQASLVVDPANGRLPALTEQGARGARRWRETASQPAGPEDLNPYDRCITRGVLGSILPNIYSSAARIFQTPTDVVIYFEMIHETRIIPIDGRPRRPAAISSYMGDPRGHWEGSTLVVETTHFNGRTGSYGRNGDGNPTSQQLRLVERFTLTDGDTLQYEVRVEDPATFTAPWTVAFPLTRADDYTMFEYACHEGNYALPNILRGVRAAEGSPVR
jgi:hypothetical protein